MASARVTGTAVSKRGNTSSIIGLTTKIANAAPSERTRHKRNASRSIRLEQARDPFFPICARILG